MMVLYDEQEVMKSSVESEVYESQIETAREILQNHEPIEKTIKYSRLPEETILKLQREISL